MFDIVGPGILGLLFAIVIYITKTKKKQDEEIISLLKEIREKIKK